MAKVPKCRTPADLVKAIHRVLGDKWFISVNEDRSWFVTAFSATTHHNRIEWRCFAILHDPIEIHVSVSAPSLAALVKRVDREFWQLIQAEYRKHAAEWTHPDDRLEAGKRGIGQKRGIERQALALTHTPNQQLVLPMGGAN